MRGEMPRESFTQELDYLQDEVVALASMVEKAIHRSVDILKRRDLEGAEQLINDDVKINERRFQIENKCIELIATQQPMAGDLRVIVTILNLITDLERIADYAGGIAKITLMLGDEPLVKPLIDIPRMAEKTECMLRESIKAFIERDVEKAKQICLKDDEVDLLYEQIYRELISYMLESPKVITRATRLLWVAHNLERAADRVTNICERVIFTVTGKMEEIGSSKY